MADNDNTKAKEKYGILTFRLEMYITTESVIDDENRRKGVAVKTLFLSDSDAESTLYFCRGCQDIEYV